MYGAPDDTSSVSHDTFSDILPTISDSDLVRDAEHVRWHHIPNPDPVSESVHSSSRDTLIEADVSNTSSRKRLGNVKAKIKAIARFLSSTKGREETIVAVSPKGIPVAGHGQRSAIDLDARGMQWDETPGNYPVPSRKVDVQAEVKSNSRLNQDLPVIETLRERLVSQHEFLSRPPPPPPPQQPRPATPTVLPSAVIAKKRHPNGLEVGLGIPRPEPPRSRSGTPYATLSVATQQILPPNVRIVSRPLPPTPALCGRSASLFLTHPPHPDGLHQPGGLGICNLAETPAPPTVAFGEIRVDTCIDVPSRVDRFPSLRRSKNQLDARLLAEELESLVSNTSRPPKSSASLSSMTRIADSSREAVCHWTPHDDDITPLSTPLSTKQDEALQRNDVPLRRTRSSLSVELSEESEAVQSIQNWRVHVKQAPSMLSSKFASEHSTFNDDDDAISSDLTSASRSPLSKGSDGVASREKDGGRKCDPDKTPTLQARRVVSLDAEIAPSFKASSKGNEKIYSVRDGAKNSVKKSDSKTSFHTGTSHIARLSDSQFDRLALASEGPSPPPPAPIPCEVPTHHLHPFTTHQPPANRTIDDDRRSSFETAGTTLSVLERKASAHIDTLESMIRRHPDKMHQVLKKHPGLMLVILLRCKVEDRISEVNASPVDLAPNTPIGGKDHVSLIEESLIDLHFDDDVDLLAQSPKQELGKTGSVNDLPLTQSAAKDMPSIVVSQHTGSFTLLKSANSVHTALYSAKKGEGMEELSPRSEARLREMVKRLEEAGELCSVQQTLIALQNKLMYANEDCSRLGERLSNLEQAVFSPNTSS